MRSTNANFYSKHTPTLQHLNHLIDYYQAPIGYTGSYSASRISGNLRPISHVARGYDPRLFTVCRGYQPRHRLLALLKRKSKISANRA